MNVPTTRPPHLPKRMFVAAAAGAMVLLAGLGVVIWASDLYDQAQEDHDRLRDLEETNNERGAVVEDLSESLDTANAHLEALGADPVTAPSDVIVGQRGETGVAGRPGEQGEPGAGGVAGQPGEPGEDGVPGEPGTDGQPGTDGPPGDPGEDGADGAMGPAGPEGGQGEPGEDGKDVESFTITWLGVTYLCTDPDDDGHFECEPA